MWFVIDHPLWLLIAGTVVTALTWYMGFSSVGQIFAFLQIGA